MGLSRDRHRPVQADRICKSIGAENTFATDMLGFEAMSDALQPVIDKLCRCCEGLQLYGRTVTLKVKFADFDLMTRSQSAAGSVRERAELERISLTLLSSSFTIRKGVQLLGVSLSSLGLVDTRTTRVNCR